MQRVKSKDPDRVRPGPHWDNFFIIQTVQKTSEPHHFYTAWFLNTYLKNGYVNCRIVKQKAASNTALTTMNDTQPGTRSGWRPASLLQYSCASGGLHFSPAVFSPTTSGQKFHPQNTKGAKRAFSPVPACFPQLPTLIGWITKSAPAAEPRPMLVFVRWWKWATLLWSALWFFFM
jgi:hypothetical protein